jgi:hypothetical protein
MERIGELIEKMGSQFRGLWRSHTLSAKDELFDEWTVTFIWKGQYVETPDFSSPVQALLFAVEKIKNE